jgi:hypothetical protein
VNQQKWRNSRRRLNPGVTRALCTSVHDNASVALPRRTTSDYDEPRRNHLGLAVTRAREAAGWPKRADFAKTAGISLRSLVKLEGGEEGVGRRVLESVGRALPNWTEDTPYEVLDGGPIPRTDPVTDNTDAEEMPPDWSEEEEQRWVVARETLHALKIRHRSEFTRTRWRTWRDEYDKLAEVERSRANVTPGDRS